MVKWMTKIIITEKESDNYYHFFDNRILPPQVPRPAQVTRPRTRVGAQLCTPMFHVSASL